MIQIDMPMPTNCATCRIQHNIGCNIAKDNGMNAKERDVRCPLKELIQCKDCKHHGEKYTHANGYEYFVCWRDGYGIHKLANGFCDCGERKEYG